MTYDYFPLVCQAIEFISQGETKTAACDKVRIKLGTFDHYIKNSVELQELFEEAKQRGYDAMADALLDPDGHGIYGRTDPKLAKVVSDNIKWILDKRDAARFGTKVQVQHTLTADRAIIDALTAGRHRASQIAYDPDVIDATPIPLTEDDEIQALCSY